MIYPRNSLSNSHSFLSLLKGVLLLSLSLAINPLKTLPVYLPFLSSHPEELAAGRTHFP